MSISRNHMDAMIEEIEDVIKEEELADGITEISTAFTHIISVAIQSGNFDSSQLHTFMERVENSIRAGSGMHDKTIGIKRMD
jgi:hypothetical protein